MTSHSLYIAISLLLCESPASHCVIIKIESVKNISSSSLHCCCECVAININWKSRSRLFINKLYNNYYKNKLLKIMIMVMTTMKWDVWAMVIFTLRWWILSITHKWEMTLWLIVIKRVMWMDAAVSIILCNKIKKQYLKNDLLNFYIIFWW